MCMFSVLRRYPALAWLWGGQLVSHTGDHLLWIALPVYVFTLTGSALATGLAFAAEGAPAVLLGPIAGVFTDRWSRRGTLLVCDLLRAGLLVPLLWCNQPSRVWIAYAVMFALSTVSQFDRPAQGALVPALVAEQDLLAANAVLSANLSMVQLVAPLAGGVLFALVGLPVIVLADIVSYLVSALTLLRVPEPRDRVPADVPPASVLSGLRDGLRTIASSTLLRACVGTTVLLSLASGFLMGVMVPYATDVLGGGSAGLGVLVTAQGAATLAGLAVAPWVARRLSVRARVTGCSIAGTVAVAGLAVAPSVPWAAVPLLATGAVAIGMLTLQTVMQTSVPSGLLGRVFAAWSSGQAAASLLGLVTAATLAEVIGVRGVLLATLPLFALSSLIPVREERPQLALA